MRPRDRKIDVTSQNMGVCTKTTLRYGSPWSVEYGLSRLSVSQYRKRVPTGGKATPRREKPFQHTSVQTNYPVGKILTGRGGRDIYAQLWEGHQGNTVFANAGLALSSAMNFPYPRPGVAARYSPGVVLGPNPDLLSQTEVKCYNRLRSETGAADLDFGLWYAERQETADLFVRGATGLLNLARAIAQKDYRKSAQVLKDAFGVSSSPSMERRRMRRVERWLRREVKKSPAVAKRTLRGLEDAALTYNLGITPMLQDVQGAHRALLTGDLPEKMRIKSVSRTTTSKQETDVYENTSEFPYTVDSNITVAQRYTVTLIATPLNTDIARLQRLGLTNPLSTLYQSTRLTFIIDYFWSLGQYLEAVNVPLGFSFVEGSWSHRVGISCKVSIATSGDNVAKGDWVVNHFQRKVYTNFPVPIPPLSLSEKILTPKQAVNTGLIALKSLRALLSK